MMKQVQKNIMQQHGRHIPLSGITGFSLMLFMVTYFVSTGFCHCEQHCPGRSLSSTALHATADSRQITLHPGAIEPEHPLHCCLFCMKAQLVHNCLQDGEAVMPLQAASKAIPLLPHTVKNRLIPFHRGPPVLSFL